MHLPVTSLFKLPYGVSFSIEDHILVRNWAEPRGLHLTVALDRKIDGAEFEEMLILSSPDLKRRVLTIWRTHATIFAQTSASQPRAFATMEGTLEALRPTPSRRSSFLRFLRLIP